jgi:hypothetical protein
MVHPGHETSTHYFPSQVGPEQFPKKCIGTRYVELVQASSGMCGSCSAFQSVQDVKHRHTIFMLGWAWCGFHKKCIGTPYVEHVILHPVRTARHVVHCSGSGRKTSTHYFSRSGGPGAVFIKSAPGHVMPNLCFCIPWDLWVT